MTLSFPRGKRHALRLSAVLAMSVFALAACGSDSDGDAASDTGAAAARAAAQPTSATSACSCPGSRTPSSPASSSPTTPATTRTPASARSTCWPARSRQEEIVATGKADFGLSNAVSTAAADRQLGLPAQDRRRDVPEEPVHASCRSATRATSRRPQDLCGKKIGVQDPNLSLFNAFLSGQRHRPGRRDDRAERLRHLPARGRQDRRPGRLRDQRVAAGQGRRLRHRRPALRRQRPAVRRRERDHHRRHDRQQARRW